MSLEKIGPYEIRSTIGSGSFSKVKLGYNTITKQEVAIKIISKKLMLSDPKNMERVRREIAIQKLINHPNVLKIYDVYETETHLFLILEYVSGGELFDYIIGCERVDSTQSRIFFQQIIYGLEQVHSFSISHRDLKPENLLLDEDNNIKIADFGMAKMMKYGTLLETACGSPHYVSPEIIRSQGYDGRKSDIWSCGVILYALLCGRLPFDQKDYRDLLLNIRRGSYAFPKFLGELEKDLISKMLVVDPEKRIMISEIKRHPWFTFNFPKNYIPPSPPIDYGKDIEKPIYLKDIDSKIVKNLSQLGLMNSKQIIKKLESNKANSIKIFYKFYEKHSNSQSKNGEDKEGGNEQKKKTRKKSLPIKKRRNSFSKPRSNKSSPTKKNKKKTKSSLKTQDYKIKKSVKTKNTNKYSKNTKSEKILHLFELIEKTDKQNDLDFSEYSQIMNESKIFEGKKGVYKNKKKEKKTFHVGNLKKINNCTNFSWNGQKMDTVLDNIGSNLSNENVTEYHDKESKYYYPNRVKSDPITIKDKNAFDNSLKKIRTRSLSMTKSSFKNKNKNKKFSLRSPINLKKINFNSFKKNKTKQQKNNRNGKSKSKNTKSICIQKKQSDIFIELDLELEENNLKKGFEKIHKQNNYFHSYHNNSNNNDNSKINIYEQNINTSPTFHRKMKTNDDFDSILSPRQEDIGMNEVGWFENYVDKKEQKKLNHQLKKQLKKTKKGLMKQLKKNQNIPIFICQNRIIALSSADSVLDLIVELQTALTICNYNWSYPNFKTLKGNIGKLEIKTQIIEKDLESMLDLITLNMSDCTSNSKMSNEEKMQEIKKQVNHNLHEIDPTGNRKWKMAIEFVWKTGSAKKFIDETKNLIRFLTQ
ncbi:protein kinase [Anaeramoeba flamelloides]|uniref:Protein kinase n=1 Tax=Anaeramoeba flamelloides TaxID=1746091 RepID=A0AAV7ZW27_9EUKA|nr:protein kinase [Anaeramoeba flamelloides]